MLSLLRLINNACIYDNTRKYANKLNHNFKTLGTLVYANIQTIVGFIYRLTNLHRQNEYKQLAGGVKTAYFHHNSSCSISVQLFI